MYKVDLQQIILQPNMASSRRLLFEPVSRGFSTAPQVLRRLSLFDFHP